MAETMPPKTVKQLLKNLDNPYFSEYVYFGAEGPAWEVAIAAQNYIAALRVVRVEPGSDEERRLREMFAMEEKHVALVFGLSRKVFARLTEAQARSALGVFDAVRDARK